MRVHSQWNATRWTEVFSTQSAMFRAAVGEADRAAPVPSCPGWTFTELTLHVARFLEVTTRYLRTGSRTQLKPPPEPPPGIEPLAYLDAQLTEAGEVLPAVPGNRPVWTFSPAAPDLAWVWHRRIAHEMNLRRWDAQAALRTLVPTAPDQAVDGIDEGLGTLLAAKATTDVPPPAKGSVAVRCDDMPQAWFVRLTPGEVPEVGPPAPGAEADATITGSATSIYYGMWGRMELPADGDARLASALRLD